MFDIRTLPQFSQTTLSGPSTITLQEFQSIPISTEQAAARKAIDDLQLAIEQQEGHMTADTLEPIHRILNGVYMRELTMPAGTIIVGKRHAREHYVTVLSGFCTVVTERGWEDIVGPCTFKSPAGEKRVFFVHEDTTLITTHRTDAKTLEEIEAELILPEAINTRIIEDKA